MIYWKSIIFSHIFVNLKGNNLFILNWYQLYAEVLQTTIQYNLNQNYRNTSNPSTSIEFSIPKEEFVTLIIYNVLGQEVANLVSNKLTPGEYKYTWDASNFGSGVYIYKIKAGSFVQTCKLILLK